MSAKRVEVVHACARTLLEQYAVKSPGDIRLELFAAECFNAKVETGPIDGAEAQLVRRGKRATITLADRVTDEAARRFNLAHELGHLALEHPTADASSLACNPHRRRRTGPEGEASCWGSEILMPTSLVAPLCQVSTVDLEVPHRIARDYTVSILASSIRFTELTNQRCAAVFTVDGKVIWCAVSKGWGKEIPKYMPVRSASVAFQYHATGELDERIQAVPADAWLDTTADAEILEHAICAPKYRSVLSMLWMPEEIATVLSRP